MKPLETSENPTLTAPAILQALASPVLVMDSGNGISFANPAAEVFFRLSARRLAHTKFDNLFEQSNAVVEAVNKARARGLSVNGRDVVITTAGARRAIDFQAAPATEKPGMVVLLILEHSMALRMDRHLSSYAGARAMTGMADILAHEIRNPLSGIRGAAQLLESELVPASRELTRLICAETDRIGALLEQMDALSDKRPPKRRPVNIHAVLARVKILAQNGFARLLTFKEAYDPSLPPVSGDHDQLIQVMLNLVKNAAEAIHSGDSAGEIILTTAYYPGFSAERADRRGKVDLPLEVCVKNSGPPISREIAAHLFEPFATNKPNGRGLGLPLAAKIIRDHGGVIECEREQELTCFRILLPLAAD